MTEDKDELGIDTPAIVSDSGSNETEPKEPQIKQDDEKKKKVSFEDTKTKYPVGILKSAVKVKEEDETNELPEVVLKKHEMDVRFR